MGKYRTGRVTAGGWRCTREKEQAEVYDDVGPCADLNRKEEKMLDGHEWQAQCIVGERQTPPGLEYEVSVAKTLWLPMATLDTKSVRRYRAEPRSATRVRTR
jgi:hypothetical protein